MNPKQRTSRSARFTQAVAWWEEKKECVTSAFALQSHACGRCLLKLCVACSRDRSLERLKPKGQTDLRPRLRAPYIFLARYDAFPTYLRKCPSAAHVFLFHLPAQVSWRGVCLPLSLWRLPDLPARDKCLSVENALFLI